MYPNRYRCDTCKFGKELVLDASNIPGDGRRYPIVYACKKNNDKWMPDGIDGGITWDVGCASHSDMVEWGSQRLIGDIDENYKDYKFREARSQKNNKIIDPSVFFDGWVYGRMEMLKELGIRGD
jgi:hypothetical protein